MLKRGKKKKEAEKKPTADTEQQIMLRLRPIPASSSRRYLRRLKKIINSLIDCLLSLFLF